MQISFCSYKAIASSTIKALDIPNIVKYSSPSDYILHLEEQGIKPSSTLVESINSHFENIKTWDDGIKQAGINMGESFVNKLTNGMDGMITNVEDRIVEFSERVLYETSNKITNSFMKFMYSVTMSIANALSLVDLILIIWFTLCAMLEHDKTQRDKDIGNIMKCLLGYIFIGVFRNSFKKIFAYDIELYKNWNMRGR